MKMIYLMPGVFTADKYFSFLWIKGKFGKLKTKKPFLSVTEIQKRIPHRFPFLLIDKVDSFEHGPDEDKLVGGEQDLTVTFPGGEFGVFAVSRDP